MHMYIQYTLIPNISEVISNGTTKDKLLETHDSKNRYNDKVGEWTINIVFK